MKLAGQLRRLSLRTLVAAFAAAHFTTAASAQSPLSFDELSRKYPLTYNRATTATPLGIKGTLTQARLAGGLRAETSTPGGVDGVLQETLQEMSRRGATHPAAEFELVGDPHEPIEEVLIAPVGQIDPYSTIPPAVSHGPYDCRLEPYRSRAYELDPLGDRETLPAPVAGDLRMWWDEAMAKPMGISNESLPIDIANLTQVTIQSSPLVQGILTEPQIMRNDMVIADAEFDSLAFVEAKFADTNEPVGSTLTTGDNSNRFRDHTFSSSLGIRKKTRRGASLELAQKGGYQDNNSTFLVPNPQGTTRLELNFTQPLLKDGGRAVNHTRVLLAQLDIKLAEAEVRADLEKHLVDVTRAYWELYQARAEWLQRNRLLEGAKTLHDILIARDGVDSLQRQVLRARAAVTSRRSDLVRAETRIRNAQAQLRLLSGSPQLIQSRRWELTPQDQPLALSVQVSTRDATVQALDNRPDIAKAIRNIQAVSARVGAAKNQVLPRLDLILSTYVAGLENKTDVFGAWVNQFADGRPSYAAGFLFEVPLGNRASRARLERNKWEMARAMHEFQQTMEVVFADVEIAVRETQTTYEEMSTKRRAIEAAQKEVAYLEQRWRLLPDPNESAVLLIEDLLDAQERLADEERAFTSSQVAYAMSWVQLRRSMGVLLQIDDSFVAPMPEMVESVPVGSPAAMPSAQVADAPATSSNAWSNSRAVQ